MRSDKNILIAFLLNLFFSIIELVGGIFTNSVAIISDAVHDFGDSISIGITYFLEKKSKKKPDDKYTFGYTRYSLLGAVVTNTILIIGSIFVIYSAIKKIFNPSNINYDGMMILALLGTIVNFVAVCATKGGHSFNQKAVNLHMLEDVLGWVIVLIGSIIIKFTKFIFIDPLLSILVTIYIFIHAIVSLKKIFELFLEKTPEEIEIDELKKHILSLKGVIGVHHIHIWSIDGYNNFATMHIVTDLENIKQLKSTIKEELYKHEICHTTIEIESSEECCNDKSCNINGIEMHHTHHH